MKAFRCDSLLTSVHCKKKKAWVETLEVTLVLYFGIAVNTALLLSSEEILWNCFRGALSLFWLAMPSSKAACLRNPSRQKGEIGSSAHDPDTLNRKGIYLLKAAWNPGSLALQHGGQPTVILCCDVVWHAFSSLHLTAFFKNRIVVCMLPPCKK